jgi:hypothetical protein
MPIYAAPDIDDREEVVRLIQVRSHHIPISLSLMLLIYRKEEGLSHPGTAVLHTCSVSRTRASVL